MEMKWDVDFARSLRMLMADRKVKNKAIAEAIGVDSSQITKWLRSGRINQNSIKKICAYFKITYIQFIEFGQTKNG